MMLKLSIGTVKINGRKQGDVERNTEYELDISTSSIDKITPAPHQLMLVYSVPKGD
jgi:hypothetical protein